MRIDHLRCLGTAGIYATIVTDPTIRNGSKRQREIISGERLARADAGEVKRTANFDRSILIHR
jgi:hypothetical protein